MLAAYQAGQSALEVAAQFGVTFHNVRYHARKAGVWEGRRLENTEFRFWRQVNKTNECWEWTGCLFPNGYGCFRVFGQSVGAHRVSYEFSKGPIPIDLTIDHLCRNKKCVNPNHLEAVTSRENTRRYHQYLSTKTSN